VVGGHADWRLLGRYFAAGASARVTAAVLMSPIGTPHGPFYSFLLNIFYLVTGMMGLLHARTLCE
jgi:hypothetical protein